MTIANGTQGMNRNDIIVRRYKKNESSEIESTEYAVIKGTPNAGAAVDPEVTTGDIRSGATLHEMALYRVKITGLNITAVEPMFNILKNMASLQKEFAELNSNKKVECFSKTVATDTNILVDFSPEVNQIIKNGGKIISAIPGTTTNSNNALVYGKVATQASSNWSEVYVRCNSNYYSGLGGTTTLTLLVVYE